MGQCEVAGAGPATLTRTRRTRKAICLSKLQLSRLHSREHSGAKGAHGSLKRTSPLDTCKFCMTTGKSGRSLSSPVLGARSSNMNLGSPEAQTPSPCRGRGIPGPDAIQDRQPRARARQKQRLAGGMYARRNACGTRVSACRSSL